MRARQRATEARHQPPGLPRWLAPAAIATAITLSGSLWLPSEGDGALRSASEATGRPAETQPRSRGTPTPAGPVLFYENDSYGCPSRGRPRLILYADGRALSTVIRLSDRRPSAAAQDVRARRCEGSPDHAPAGRSWALPESSRLRL